MRSSELGELERQLNDMILAGEILPAFERFYHEDVVMQENTDPPCEGKAANRAREQKFVENVEQMHEVSLHGVAVADDLSYSEWIFDISFKGGFRVRTTQVAARRWRDGQVIHERFYYKPLA